MIRSCLWLFTLVSWGFEQATAEAGWEKCGIGIESPQNHPDEATGARYLKNVILRTAAIHTFENSKAYGPQRFMTFHVEWFVQERNCRFTVGGTYVVLPEE
jgi:hypothetical protein